MKKGILVLGLLVVTTLLVGCLIEGEEPFDSEMSSDALVVEMEEEGSPEFDMEQCIANGRIDRLAEERAAACERIEEILAELQAKVDEYDGMHLVGGAAVLVDGPECYAAGAVLLSQNADDRGWTVEEELRIEECPDGASMDLRGYAGATIFERSAEGDARFAHGSALVTQRGALARVHTSTGRTATIVIPF